MESQVSANVAGDASAMETTSEVGSPEEVYEIVADGLLDFDSWTSLISEVEKTYSDNIKAISSVYESFLSLFPLCSGYWKRYADHKARLCTVEKAVKVFEQAVQSATYSVELWVDYCSFSMIAFADPSDIRRIFERGLSLVGKDFSCHRLWDLYIRFELSQQQWSRLAHILIRSLKFPTKSVHKYYDNFREFTAFIEEEMSCPKNCNLEPHLADSNEEITRSNDAIYLTIKKLQNSTSVDIRTKSLYKLISISERFYRKSCKLHEEIDYFENYMERDSFHVKPLEDEELENWHNYLDFIEKQEDFDWAVKLYERCLISCANYPEFWMRYVEFMESKGGREIATFALERATQVFLKNVSELHVFNARFREKIGDIEGARAALHFCDTESDSSFIETAIKEANMEKRLGNLDTALGIYDKALTMAAEKEKMHIIPILYINLFRLKYLISGSEDDSMELLIAGIHQVPNSRLLLEELINFAMMHDGSRHLNVVDPIMATVITCGSDGLSSKDREDLSHLYLKFVDYCGTTNDVRKAWNRHIKYFPHLTRNSSSHNSPSNQLMNQPEKVRESQARLVVKQPIISISAKNQAIEPHRGTNDDNSENLNAPLQQSEDNNAAKNDSSEMIGIESGPHDQVRSEPEEQKEHDVEIPLKPVSLENPEKEPNDLNQNTESTEKQNETDENGSQNPSFPTNPQQIPSQDTETCSKTNHTLPCQQPQVNDQNVQPPNLSSAPMVQYPVQNNEQSGQTVQDTNVYNQMWQYQYQQYQQNPNQNQNLSQQQWMQMQQSYQYQQMYQQQDQYQQYMYQVYQQQQQDQGQQYLLQQQQQDQGQQHLLQQQQQQQKMQEYYTWMQQYQYMQQQMQQQGQGTVPPHPTSTNAVAPPILGSPSSLQPSTDRASSVPSKSLHSPSFDQT